MGRLALAMVSDRSWGGRLIQRFVDHFASVSGDYAAFRPTYPPGLFDWLAAIAPSHSLAWDCATGTGQAAIELVKRFDRVVATDASSDQIAAATPHPRVEYRVAAAEESGIQASSAALVTVAQALHWFAIDRFFGECARVLAPGGVLAVWSYGPLRVASKTLDRALRRYYRDIVGHYWPPERALVDSGYASVVLPYAELEVPPFEMQAYWTLSQLVGYLGTWSATVAYRNAIGDDPCALIAPALERAWCDPHGPREITWPLRVRVCRKDSVY